jgi:ribosomal-protein-alanine acetyltransferase
VTATSSPTVTPMTLADLDEVVAIERLSHPIPKGRESFEHDLANPVARCWVLCEGTRVIGYLVVWVSDVAEIIDIAIHPEYRGKKLADRLMARACGLGLEVVLEVRAHNHSARRLYERHGFVQVGVRKGYYADNGEDAFVMRRDARGDVVARPERPEQPEQGASRAHLVSGLYPILSDDVLPARDFAAAARILAPHVTVIQLRFKVAADDVALPAMREVAAALTHWEGLLVINDRADLLMLLVSERPGPLGLHIGQDDLPLPVARRLIGDEVVLGFSTHDPAQLESALASRVPDYVAYGPVFGTTTKKNPDPVVGLTGPAGLSGARDLVGRSCPLVAIGGLTPERAKEVSQYADAVAVIGALTGGGLGELPQRLETFLPSITGARA